VVLNILDQAVRYEEGMEFARLAIETGAGRTIRGGAEWFCCYVGCWARVISTIHPWSGGGPARKAVSCEKGAPGRDHFAHIVPVVCSPMASGGSRNQ
jgi:hypothetical protein